jgi:hypothetical protein
MYKVILHLRLPVRAMGTRLSRSQEAKLRTHLRNVQINEHRRRKEAIARTGPTPTITPKRTPIMHEYAKTCGCCNRRWIFRSETDEGQPLCSYCVERPWRPQQLDDKPSASNDGPPSRASCRIEKALLSAERQLVRRVSAG